MMCPLYISRSIYIMRHCPLIEDINFSYSVKVGSTSSLHCKVTVFPFVISDNPWGDI